MTHLTLAALSPGPYELQFPLWKTNPDPTFVSQVDKWSLHPLMLLSDVPPLPLVVLNFDYACLVLFIALPSLILFSPFLLEAMSHPAAGTPLSLTGPTAAL